MKTDKRFLQSEQAIIESSIQTLLYNYQASMSEIASAAGIGRATLYRHFPSREALIEKLVLVCLAELEEALAPFQHLSGRAALEAEIKAMMPLADRFHFLTVLWDSVADNETIQSLDKPHFKNTAKHINQAKAAGAINSDLPTEWLVAFYESTFFAAWYLRASDDLTIEEAAIYTKQSFFNGCERRSTG